MINIKSKQGNSVVFLTIILSSLIAITLTLVYSSREYSKLSIADGALNLAGSSVLSEYDYYVQKDYGLFLLSGTDKQLSEYLCDYSGLPAKVTAGRYNASNLDPITKQIVDYMKSTVNFSTEKDIDLPKRTLKHQPTITSLPSRSLPDKNILVTVEKLAESLKNPEAIFRTGTNKFLLDSYILKKFNSDKSIIDSDHFFAREAEYVICGKMSDEDNQKQVDLALKVFRTVLNLAHIYADRKKTAAVVAAAEAITPGPLGTVTQLGISTAWATAEAINDVKLLHKGYKVPIIKGEESWAINLDSIIAGYNAEDGCLVPKANRGEDYTDYLRILLFTKDSNIKTARILDLIQINMRKSHDKNFIVNEHATGISIDGDIDGKKLSYDKIY